MPSILLLGEFRVALDAGAITGAVTVVIGTSAGFWAGLNTPPVGVLIPLELVMTLQEGPRDH